MLIVNADDWGRCPAATDNSLVCFRNGRITSTSAMVFMADSVRGAKLASEAGIDTGLHINLSEEFSGEAVLPEVRRAHNRIRRFLRRNKYALLLYNPFLRHSFALVFQAQLEEFKRLFGREPSHFDGHQHMHLCSNMLFQRLIPRGAKVRRSFSFSRGEKNPVNRGYRSLVDRHLTRNHRVTDCFYALSMHFPLERLDSVLEQASRCCVELMNHPQVDREFDALMSDTYARKLVGVPLGTYSTL